MNCLRALLSSTGALRVSCLFSKPRINSTTKRYKPSQCDNIWNWPQNKKPCFDPRKVTLERAHKCHSKMIRSFLRSQYWPREPTIMSLWVSLNSPYLEILTDKYSNTGDRFLAFERKERTNEKKLIGVLVANTVWPWMMNELEEWAHSTESKPERNRMYFSAHCLRSPNLFKKYNVSYIYNVEVLGTSAEVAGHGVATRLLRQVLDEAVELRHPLVQVVAINQYISTVCERCGMQRVWSMDYSEFVDDAGQRVFFPRHPHYTVAIYVKYFNPKICGKISSKPPS